MSAKPLRSVFATGTEFARGFATGLMIEFDSLFGFDSNSESATMFEFAFVRAFATPSGSVSRSLSEFESAKVSVYAFGSAKATVLEICSESEKQSASGWPIVSDWSFQSGFLTASDLCSEFARQSAFE
jgi:hypothetical protein